ncbi:hypothetical protein AAZX31_02G016900 [Glycine max]|nr:Pentatricopeptide repeat-containing protein [Glycine max]
MRASAKVISYTHPSLHLSYPNIESFGWNNLIRANTRNRVENPSFPPALPLYLRMRHHAVLPDLHTFPFLLQSINTPHPGRQLHAQIFLLGLANDPFVQTSLIIMYSSCGTLTFARQVFDEITQPDLPSWNAIIHANAKAGMIHIARKLFDQMPHRNVISWSCMIHGYASCGEYKAALSLFRSLQTLEGSKVQPNELCAVRCT